MKSTINRLTLPAFVALIAILTGIVSPVLAQPLETYTRTDTPASWLGSPVTDGGWTYQGKGSTGQLTVPANGSLYFAFENTHVEANKKTLGVEFKTTPPGAARLDVNVGMVKAYNDDGTSNEATVNECSKASEHTGKIGVNATITPQPEWEMIEIKNTAAQDKTIEVEVAHSTCGKRNRTTGGNGVPDSQMEFSDHMFGAPGNLPNTTLITAVEVYPRNVDIDQSVAPFFEAPPHTGNWTPEFVSIDPNGAARPHGGVRWTTDGMGLAAGEMHLLSFTMSKAADTTYDFFTFDEEFGEFFKIMDDLGGTPWYEDFETHYPNVGCGGWRGWKGWDDDPAFDAPATNGQAHDGANSLNIVGDGDLVHEFEGVDEGLWSFSAWQYIPSDYVAGGVGQLEGSWFLLLNTYQDGGPYNWSMGLHAVDDVIRVYQGAGYDSIDVPYETDRWTKIQVIVDLDDDWTRVYYDDDFITEYQWTGGIFGDGGGALDIACVDLYAHTSSSVYYDDLALEKLEPIDADILEITPVTGTILDGGIAEIQESDDQYLHTRAGIGETHLDPRYLTLDIAAQARADVNLIDVKIETRLSQPFGVTRVFMHNWITDASVPVSYVGTFMTDQVYTFTDIDAQDYVREGDGRIELRIQQSSLAAFSPFVFDSYFDQIEIQTK